jgi:hypothetical protein
LRSVFVAVACNITYMHVGKEVQVYAVLAECLVATGSLAEAVNMLSKPGTERVYYTAVASILFPMIQMFLICFPQKLGEVVSDIRAGKYPKRASCFLLMALIERKESDLDEAELVSLLDQLKDTHVNGVSVAEEAAVIFLAIDRDDLALQFNTKSEIDSMFIIIKFIAAVVRGKLTAQAMSEDFYRMTNSTLRFSKVNARLPVRLLVDQLTEEKINAIEFKSNETQQRAHFIGLLRAILFEDNKAIAEQREANYLPVLSSVLPENTNYQALTFTQIAAKNNHWVARLSNKLGSLDNENILEPLRNKPELGPLMPYLDAMSPRFWQTLIYILDTEVFLPEFKAMLPNTLLHLLEEASRAGNRANMLSLKIEEECERMLTNKRATAILKEREQAKLFSDPKRAFKLVEEYVTARLGINAEGSRLGFVTEFVSILKLLAPMRFLKMHPNQVVDWAKRLREQKWWAMITPTVLELLRNFPELITNLEQLEKLESVQTLNEILDLVTTSPETKPLILKIFADLGTNIGATVFTLKELLASTEVMLPNGKMLARDEILAHPYSTKLIELAKTLGTVTPTLVKILFAASAEEYAGILKNLPLIKNKLLENRNYKFTTFFAHNLVEETHEVRLQAELIAAFISPVDFSFEAIEHIVKKLSPTAPTLLGHVKRAGLPEYNEIRKVELPKYSIRYTVSEENLAYLATVRNILPRPVVIENADYKGYKWGNAIIPALVELLDKQEGLSLSTLLNLPGGEVNLLTVLPYLLISRHGGVLEDSYNLAELMNYIFSPNGIAADKIMAKLSQARKFVDYLHKENVIGLDLRDKLPENIMHSLGRGPEESSQLANKLLAALQPALGQLAVILKTWSEYLKASEVTTELAEADVRTLELRFVISKSIASFFAKGALDLCTDIDVELFLRSSHFHLNIIDPRSGLIVGNIQLYIVKNSKEKYLMVRGLNMRSGYLKKGEVPFFVKTVFDVAKQIQNQSKGFDKVVLSEGLELWHADSNDPDISDHLRAHYNNPEAEISLKRPFNIAGETSIMTVYEL